MPLEIYIARGPQHWVLITRIPKAPECTWYHCTGGPSQQTPYERKVQGGIAFAFAFESSRSLHVCEYVTTIETKDFDAFHDAAADGAALGRAACWRDSSSPVGSCLRGRRGIISSRRLWGCPFEREYDESFDFDCAG
ncbi:hypothetical protein P175DRAFT_0491356 [Aspergillus ochraceoroseus IBT 24754]|uniref:Uncharacterized protein n=1 Tax=Aspergillus ochraceoroseus IBT 24754 TaxID=1392256 RepID=A0A2T5M341_9EURO|nr:uncharacterized protein P175DRAFT_0491356 [Aspergillus ochraceoroseus IBT 24754]PTU22948.1 hypothetical protein P175DRAFT_0491356 [Aspergillus ochraceoroseus IBT 24754]